MTTGPREAHRRLALFLPALSGGGAERVMVTLADGFVRRGLSVDLVLVKARGPYLAEVPAAVRIVALRSSRVSTSAMALAGYLRRERPFALLSTLNNANIVAVVAKRLAGVRTRAVVRQADTLSVASRLGRGLVWPLMPALARTAYPCADAIVAVSRSVAEDLVSTLGVPSQRITVIPNPVVTSELFRLAKEQPKHPWFEPGEPPVVLGVGRLSRQKDFATLIHAFARVHRGRACRLVILGEGEERPALERLSAELGASHAVSLPGFVANPFAFMARAAVFVSSSSWEGLPGALIQALACGTPAIATDCPGGSREVLRDGRFGCLVPVGEVAALAVAIAAALERGRPAVPPEAWSRFTQDSAVEGYVRILRGSDASN
jgi:glycosyltransferase involved in cell wall biosynthesis